MVFAFSWALAALWLTLLGVSHALLSTTPPTTSRPGYPTSVSRKSSATTATPQPSCPIRVSLTNGGFESGNFAPWVDEGPPINGPQVKIISPGYKSKHAVQLEFPASNETQYTFAQAINGEECYGYYYNISYAFNWKEYTGPEGSGPAFCRIEVLTGYTDGSVLHYATRKPGWHHHSYLARNVYGCGTIHAEFVVRFTCESGSEVEALPPFTVLMDQFKMKNVPRSPNPLPTGPCF